MTDHEPPSLSEIAPGVKCSSALIHDVAGHAADGYRRVPWGGVELGGLLLGRRSEALIEILEVMELECEHQFGPGFQLSAEDMKALESTLADLPAAELEVVGWFRTTSRDLAMESDDVALANRFFVDARSLTLIVHRGKQMVPRFGLFTKDTSVRPTAYRLAREFTAEAIHAEQPVDPASEADPAPALEPEPVEAVPQPDPEPEPASVAPVVAELEVPITEPPVVAAPAPFIQEIAPAPLAAATPEPEPEPTPVAPPADLPVIVQTPPAEIQSFLPGTSMIRTVVSLAPQSAPPEVETHQPALDQLIDNTPELIDDGLAFFGLSLDPFVPSPDPAFYFDSDVHREAQAVLDYGIAARKGVILLTGNAGTGKTILLQNLAERLRKKRVDFALLLNPKITVADLYEMIAYDLRLQPASASKVHLYIALQERAVQRAGQGSTLVLLVDDAHRLSVDVLEELELLNNIESRRGKLIQLVLAAHPELHRKLNLPALTGLKQRVLLRAQLGSLSASETDGYIRFRLSASGGDPDLFPPDLTRMIYEHSGGTPRLINSICSSALDLAFRNHQSTLDQTVIDLAAAQFA
jgi:general secretion pathway protein A